MRLINTKVHALLDYLLAVLLTTAPWIFEFPPAGPKYHVALVVGITAIVLALITRFEYAPFKLMPLRVHLIIDVVSGIFLAVSPWIFEFRAIIFKPHLVFGITHAVVAILTDRMLYDKVKTLK